MTGATIALTGPDHRAAFRASTFGDVLRSEWTKLRSVRSTFWALTVTVVLGIALGAVISAATAHGYAKFSVSEKLSWDPTGVSGAGMAIAQLAIAVLGVLCISFEYSSGMIRTSLIAVPKRGRVLAAKSLVFAGVTFVAGAPGERVNAQLKTWKILTKLRYCPRRAGQLAKAIHWGAAPRSERQLYRRQGLVAGVVPSPFAAEFLRFGLDAGDEHPHLDVAGGIRSVVACVGFRVDLASPRACSCSWSSPLT